MLGGELGREKKSISLDNHTSVTEGLINHKVESLLENGSMNWDRDLIRDMFNERDQHCILDVTLEAHGDDTLFWLYENTGIIR